MRKNITVLLLAFIGYAGYAQTAYDAFLFSENNYEGTARTMAMGNAFTALGGDLGAIGLNPAGSAVAKYSQLTITPGLTFSTNITQGVSPYEDGSLPYFDRSFKNNATRFSLPNIGFTFNFNTNRTSGIKNITLGFVSNRVNSWDENVYAAGMNSGTSFMGSMAALATENGYLGSILGHDDAYNVYPWKDVVGYQSGMISTFGGYDDQFVGASELIFENNGQLEIGIGGPLNQTYGREVRGYKNDYLINFGMNISDFIYIGANFGISGMNYSYSEYFKEVAADPADFAIALDNGETMYFSDMKYRYDYVTSTTGYYGKFGFILTPGAGLRIGAAIQTPTATIIEEDWRHYGETNFTDSRYDAYASSPQGEDRYSFTAPYRANFGLAYTLGGFAVISADYEFCDYSTMKFKTKVFDDSREYFDMLNQDIKTIYGKSHMLRLGAEIKPVQALAIRAGYGLTTSPEKATIYGDPLEAMKSQQVSAGLGYISKKSFFADLACRYAFATDEYFMPYADYIYDDSGYILEPVPEILNRKSAWKVLLTFGWRF